MNIYISIFEVFDRKDFIYRVKEESSTKVKREYTSAWDEWKAIVEILYVIQVPGFGGREY